MAVAVTYALDRGGVVDDIWLFTAVAGQAITTDAISTDVLDLGANRADDGTPGPLYPGDGTPMRIKCVVTAAFAGGTSLLITLETSEDAGLASAVVLSQTPALAQAKLVKGTVFYLDIPPRIGLDRYLGLSFDDTGAFTGGKIACFLEAL